MDERYTEVLVTCDEGRVNGNNLTPKLNRLFKLAQVDVDVGQICIGVFEVRLYFDQLIEDVNGFFVSPGEDIAVTNPLARFKEVWFELDGRTELFYGGVELFSVGEFSSLRVSCICLSFRIGITTLSLFNFTFRYNLGW